MSNESDLNRHESIKRNEIIDPKLSGAPAIQHTPSVASAMQHTPSIRRQFSLRSQRSEDAALARATHNMSEMVVNVSLDNSARELDRECVAETQEIEFVNELKFSPCR